jgi:ribose/xylose/arabinose/galactoside ABC-type transport system permease subunit
MAALGGVIVSSRIMAGAYNVGEGLEFEVIAAVVIGGTSLSGGAGSMLGTFVGVLFIGLLANGMTLMGVDPYWQEVARGLIVLVAVLISAARNVRRD